MKIVVIAALVAFTNADVNQLANQEPYLSYQYQNPAPENPPHSSYGVPQASVLGNTAQKVSEVPESASAPQLILPSVSGPAVDFTNGASAESASGVTIQTYNGFSSPDPSAGLSAFQVSTPIPSLQVSGSGVNVDTSSFQVSTPAPSVDLTGFQVSAPAVPSVNLVQYSQPENSYQFLSKLSQPSSISVTSVGLSPVNGVQFGSDALLNTGVSIASAQTTPTRTSGGNLNDAFGVVTDAAGHAEASQAPEVSKQLYFFAAPEEEEEEDVQARVELPPVPPKKTYKIIFIKAPTYRNQASITIPAQPQNEEKTLVYVLVKKPEGQAKVRFQTALPAQPTKPEVFFIKYKTQKEAEAAVADIQTKYGASGHVIANLPAGSQPAPQLQTDTVSVSSTPSPVDLGTNGITSLLETDVRIGASVSPVIDPEADSTGTTNVVGRIPGEPVQGSISLISQSVENANTQFGTLVRDDTPLSQVIGTSIASNGLNSSIQPEESSNEASSTNLEPENQANPNTDIPVVEQKVGLPGDIQGEGTQTGGFALYGPPKF